MFPKVIFSTAPHSTSIRDHQGPSSWYGQHLTALISRNLSKRIIMWWMSGPNFFLTKSCYWRWFFVGHFVGSQSAHTLRSHNLLSVVVSLVHEHTLGYCNHLGSISADGRSLYSPLCNSAKSLGYGRVCLFKLPSWQCQVLMSTWFSARSYTHWTSTPGSKAAGRMLAEGQTMFLPFNSIVAFPGILRK